MNSEIVSLKEVNWQAKKATAIDWDQERFHTEIE